MEEARGRSGGSASRKAKSSKSAAKPAKSSGHDDVSNGPPKSAKRAPLGPEDYAEIFGGIANCNIPYLHLPPVDDKGRDAAPSDVDYLEVFGGREFTEFTLKYEDLVAEVKPCDVKLKEKVSSNKRTSRQTTASHVAEEASKFHQEHLDEVPLVCPENYHFLSDSHNLSSSSSQSHLPCGIANVGIRDNASSGTKYIAEHDHVSMFSSADASNPLQAKRNENPLSNGRGVKDDRKPEVRFSHTFSSDASRSSVTYIVADQKQVTNQYNLSKNDNANLYHHSRSSSSHSASSGDVSSSNVMYASVSDISLRTQPLGVPPPSRPPPKILHKQPTVKMGLKPKVAKNHEKHTAENFQGHEKNETVNDSHRYCDVEIDSSLAAAASAAAIKEAMEQAEATLKSAKELMERNRDNFNVRKKVGQKGMKMDYYSFGAERFDERFSDVTTLKEGDRFNDIALKETMLDQKKVNECNRLNGIALKEIKKPKDNAKSRLDSKRIDTKVTANPEYGSIVNDIVPKERWEFKEAAKYVSQQMETKATIDEEDGNLFSGIISGKRNTVTDARVNAEAKKMGSFLSIAEGDEKKMSWCALESCQIIGELKGNPGQWRTDKEYYEQIRNEKKCKKIAEFSESESLHTNNTTVAKVSEKSEKGQDETAAASEERKSESGHKDTAAAAEVEPEVPLKNNYEKIKEEESLTRSKYDSVPFAAEEIKVTSAWFRVTENIGPEKGNGHHGKETQKVEDAQVNNHEEVEFTNEFSLGKTENEPEPLNIFEGNYQNEEEKTDYSDAKKVGGNEGNSFVLEEIHGNENDQVKSVTTERAFQQESKHSAVNLTREPCDSEETLVKKEIKVLNGSCFGELDERESTFESGDSEVLFIKETKHDNIEISNQMEKAGSMHYHEEGQKLGMKQETHFSVDNSTKVHEDNKDDPEEIFRNIKAAERTILREKLNGEQEKLVKPKNSAFEENIRIKEKTYLTEVSKPAFEEDCSENKGQDESPKVNSNHEDTRAPFMTRSSEKKADEENNKIEKDNNDIKRSNLQSDYSHTTQESHHESSSLELDVKLVNVFERKGNLSGTGQDECQDNKQQQEVAQTSCMPRSSEEKRVYEKDFESREDNERKEPEVQYDFLNSDATQEILHEVSRDFYVQQFKLLGKKGHPSKLAPNAREGDAASSQKQISATMEEKEIEKRMDRDRRQAEKQARKLEEEKEREREREREREKDRKAVERATYEAHDRALAEAKERAERIAVERVTAEARKRALKEAREKAERATAEALEKSLAEKAAREAKLRAERAAVERATAEARERAAERARAEKAAADARDRAERSNVFSRDRTRKEIIADERAKADTKDGNHSSLFQMPGSSSNNQGVGESELRYKARLERHQRTAERAARALAEKNKRDILAQREQAERHRLAEYLDADIKRWSTGKEGNLRALLSTLQYILGPDSGWKPIPLTEVITAAAVKKAYRKATLCVHPDKLQQRGANIQQKYICEKVFDLLKEAWNRYNSEER